MDCKPVCVNGQTHDCTMTTQGGAMSARTLSPKIAIDLAHSLHELQRVCRENSERWFPHLHGADAAIPLPAFYAMGLNEEAGEVMGQCKKLYRKHTEWTVERLRNVGAECADTFIYLILLCDELDIDLIAEVQNKMIQINEARFG